jgi:hypothetical protein
VFILQLVGGEMGVLQQVYLKVRSAQIFLSVHFDLTYYYHRRSLHRYLQEFFLLTKTPESKLSPAEIRSIWAAVGAFPFLPAAASFFCARTLEYAGETCGFHC